MALLLCNTGFSGRRHAAKVNDFVVDYRVLSRMFHCRMSRSAFTFVSNLFFASIHWLIHVIFTVFELLFKWQRSVSRKNKYGDRTVDSLRNSFSKIPNHVAIIANITDSDLNAVTADVASLVYWCSLLEVHYISVYDSKGLLIKRKHAIEDRINNSVISDDKRNVTLRNGFTKPCFKLNNKNHISEITFLSSIDGKAQIVNITQQIARKKTMNCLEKDVTVPNVSTLLRKEHNFEDPDLAIILGTTPCVYGYPPWQLRLTEIINIPSFGKLEIADFIEVIMRFNKCEQRFGK